MSDWPAATAAEPAAIRRARRWRLVVVGLAQFLPIALWISLPQPAGPIVAGLLGAVIAILGTDSGAPRSNRVLVVLAVLWLLAGAGALVL